MALIQKIRQKSGLVLALMILAIVSFIAMLITQDSNRNWSDFSNTTSIGSVNGKVLEMRDMERTVETLFPDRAGDLGVRNALFNYFVENTLVSEEAAKLGLGVCKDELLDLEFGPNPSPVITQTPGLQNPEQLMQIKQAIQSNQLPPQFKAYWAEIEKQVIKERLQGKISNLIYKSIYTPSWLIEETEKANGQSIDIEFVRVPFDRVEDKDITLSDGDYSTYINDNRARFDADEEARQIEFVAFDVIPSAADSTKLLDKIMKVKADFSASKNDSTFVMANNGEFSRMFMTKAQLAQSNAAAADSLFSAPVGSLIGPYVDAKAYVVAKILERKSSPDSVRSRHILIRGGAETMKTADSLKNILTANPTQWDSINARFSGDDVAKTRGGDLNYVPQGMMVPEFNDLIFYKAQQGPFYTVQTQFGAHIVQVTGVKAGKNENRVKVAYVREAIIPSSETDRKASSAADELLTSSRNLEDLRKNAQAKGLQIQPTPPYRASDARAFQSIGSPDAVRQLARWVYEAKTGERCKTTFGIRETGDGYNSRYVVAGLKTVLPKGLPSVAAVKEQIMPLVKNRLKGEVLAAKINTSDLNALATQFNAKVDTSRGLSFNSQFIPNLGAETKVVGAAFTTEMGQVTKPIVGETGVFVAKVVNKNAVPSTADRTQLREQLNNEARNRVMSPDQRTGRQMLIKGLVRKADITDNRLKFF